MNGVRRKNDPDCTCDETEGCYHSCPYAVEIQDADPNEDTCDCCPSCECDCALSI